MTKPLPGIFITFEGTEGSGKSTLIKRLSTILTQDGYRVTSTREPGGNSLAEKIRDLLLKMPMDPMTELLLYEAARSEHLHLTVRPALARGDIVLCDRFTDSTLAYQAHARGLPWNQVKVLNRQATQGLRPGMTVLLDIDPAEGLARVQNPNRFEAEGIEFQKKVRNGYLKARKDDPKRWLIVKTKNKTPDQLADHVIQEMFFRFNRHLVRLRSG